MTESEIAEFRRLIEARLEALDQEDRLGEAGRATVALDQQSVGRLSRMDALQSQAMSKASQARRNAERSRLTAAIGRIEDREFGYCHHCGEDIALPRLTLDPAATSCIECAQG